MAFKKVSQSTFRSKITTPLSSVFTKEQGEYLQSLIRDTEKSIENAYTESRRVLSSDSNPVREIVSLDGKTGSLRVDLGLSQLSFGAPVWVYAQALAGNVTITGMDNAYNGTIVYVINGDPTSSITVQHNSEILSDSGTDVVLGQNNVVSFVQIKNAPLWLQATTAITNA